MEVIPVIDLKSGAVVHARAGDRERYEPIRSPLCASSAPLEVVRGLLEVYSFTTLYVADLDAIEGVGSHADDIAAIARVFPQLALWVDAGLDGVHRARSAQLPQLPTRATPVFGTESMRDVATLRAVAQAHGEDWILSLDYRDERLLGVADAESVVDCWPSRIIVMTLGRVGSETGPDYARLQRIRSLTGAGKTFAAGGVRGGEDLQVLAGIGVSGALVATALHDGRLSRAGIAAVASGPA